MTPLLPGNTPARSGAVDPTAETTAVEGSGARSSWPSRRLALGLSPTPRPGLVLLLVGMALGPQGLGVLSASVLALLDPGVSMALAALGVLVGLEVRLRGPRQARLFAAASLESAVTILVVGGGAALMQVRSAPGATPWLLALTLGVCAAASSAAVEPAEGPRASRARIGELDDVLPIVVGVATVAWARSSPTAQLAWLVAQTAAIALSIACASWLLVTQTASQSEQRVFAIGTLLLLGGAAAYLSVSALMIGLLAGIFWNGVGGSMRDRVERDVGYLQHPLMVLLLVIAGARLTLTRELLGPLAGYVAFRTVGKLTGGWLAGRMVRELPSDFGLWLMAPGLVGVAIALNLLQSRPDSEVVVAIFAIVVTGSLLFELLSIVAAPRDRSA